MKKLIYATCNEVEKEDGTTVVVPVEGTTIIPDSDLETFLPIAQAEAYEGRVIVEDIPDPVTEPTQLDRVEAQATYTAMLTDTLLDYEEV